jgi:hypothetical protein
MAFESLLQEIDAEISRLHQAKVLLSGTHEKHGPGRPAKAVKSAKTATRVKAASPKRTLSPQARKRIGDALRARWAKVKAEQAKTGKKS